MITVNKVMHNTQWVPGHFHIYLILGEVAMSFGFMVWLVRGRTGVVCLSAEQTGWRSRRIWRAVQALPSCS